MAASSRMPITAFSSPVAFPSTRTNRVRRSVCMPTCSAVPVPRRHALQLVSLSVAATLLPSPARSESTYEKNVRQGVAKVSLGREKADELKKTASGWKDVMDEDDELYVLRFIPIWLEPLRVAMGNVGKQESVDVGDAAAIKSKALDMMGHLLELRAESKARKKDGVIRELDEILETADDFLKLPGVERFVR